MIKKIKIGLNNLYLFKNEKDKYLLLDTGLASKEKEILDKLNKEIGDFRKIEVIVLTHSHSDHIGNLKFLISKLKNENIKVIAHLKSKNTMLNGEKNIPNGSYKFTKYISKKLKNKISKSPDKISFPRLSVEETEDIIFLNFENYDKYPLKDFDFENINLIYTKGHSEDSISLEYKEDNRKYLFCGDTVQNLLFKIPLIPLFSDNIEDLVETWERIIRSNYDKIFPAMGKFVKTEDLKKALKKYLEKYEKYRI